MVWHAMCWGTSIQVLGTDVAARTYGATICTINSWEKPHYVCPMLVSNCALAIRTWSHELLLMAHDPHQWYGQPTNNHPEIYR